MKKKILIFLVAIPVVLIVVFALLFHFFASDSIPDFFPFDDNGATYTIIKKDNYYYVHYLSTSDKNKYLDCKEVNKKDVCKEIIDKDVEILVGESAVDLSNYLNKNVILTGNFGPANKQCLIDQCVDLDSSYAVVNIKSLAER